MNRLEGVEHKRIGTLAFYSEEDRQASKLYWKHYEKACRFLKEIGIEN